jgi:hypothetical protein
MSNPDLGGAPAQTHPATARSDTSHSAAQPGTSSQSASTGKIVAAGKVQRSRGTPDSSNDESSPSGAKPINPCKLVSLAEAQSITQGGIVGTVEAPLGPTCLYRAHDPKATITMAIETLSYARVTRHLGKRKELTVAHRHAACGRLGRQMLYVRLRAGQVLNVTAPCRIARQFAALALSRLIA